MTFSFASDLKIGKSFSYNFIPANFFFFLFGIFSYNFYEWLTANKIKPKYFFHLSVIFLFAVFLWNYIPDIKLGWIIIKEWGFYLATPFFIPLIFLSFNRTPLNNIMADLSYPVYISHLLIIYFLQTVLNLQPSFSLYSFWILCITLVFSVAIVYLIERPIDKFRQRRIKKGKQN